MKICTKCKKSKEETEFTFKLKNLGLRHGQCRDCTRLSVKKHYNKNRKYYLNKTQKRNSLLMNQELEYIQKYLLEHPCIDCKETDIIVLEFDHRSEFKKFKAISSMLRARYPLQKIKDEILKCEVRCANCHRRKTAKQFKWSKAKMRSSFNG